MNFKAIKVLAILLAMCNLSFANMAKPYVDGTESSTLFGSKNCKVLSETIDLTAIPPVDKDDYPYRLNYKVSYQVLTEQDGKLPLLFIGQTMTGVKSLTVNGKMIQLKTLNKQNASQFKFLTKSQSGGDFYDITFEGNNIKWGIQLNELVYFEAPLLKGENQITIAYDGMPEYNVYGLLRAYEIDYALYPSNFWKSFGAIKINIYLPKETEIRDVNVGTLTQLKDGEYQLIINKITADNLKITFSKRISYLAKALLFLEPIGLAIVAFLVAGFFHFKWMKKLRIQRQQKYNYAVPVGALLVTVVFYMVFLFSNNIIYWLTEETGLKQGYILLAIFTAPIFIICYWIVMGLVDYSIKKKLRLMVGEI